MFVLPLWFLVVGALRPVGQPPPLGVELLPPSPTLENFRRLPGVMPLATYLRNSAVVVALAVPLTVLVASWAGFGIRLLRPRWRRGVLIASLVLLMVPVTAVWATRYEVLRLLQATDNLVPLVIPALAGTSPFFVLIYAWSFGGIPDGHLEAARLEGASPWRIWRSVAMPQVKPATLAVGVLAFTAHWGNFIDAVLYLRSQTVYTLPLGLRFLQLLNPTDFPLLLAGAVVLTLPAVAVFGLAQRLFLDDPLTQLRRKT